MCTGVETALLVTALVGTGVSAYSAIEQGQAQKKAADENAAIAEANAQAAEDKAKYDEAQHREKVKRLLSSQRALYGASGVDMEGSPLMVQADTLDQGNMDALAIRKGGSVAAAEQRSMANLYRMQGKSARTSSYLSAGSTLLSGANSGIKTYYGIK